MSEFSDTAAAIGESILHALEPRFLKNGDGREFLLLPPGQACDHQPTKWEVQEVTQPNALDVLAPKLIIQSVKVQEVGSLMNYVNRFKNADSALFADISSSTILGVIDYHTAANGLAPNPEDTPPTAVPEARHTKHTVSLTMPKSIEWETWLGIDGRLMRHVDFSNFLEENSMDILPLGTAHDRNGEIIEDAPTTILELCREMQVKSSYGAASEVRNGDYISVEMQKGDDVSTKKNVALPVSIDLNIPVYFGEQPVLIKAFMRRKVIDGQLSLGIKLQRPEQARQDEFKRIVAEIEQGVELATLYGKPA